LIFAYFCSLSWSAFSELPAFIFFLFFFIFLGKKRILGNHPKLGDDSCPPLYNAYGRKSYETLDSKRCKEEKKDEI
jgi:hypothetical protein